MILSVSSQRNDNLDCLENSYSSVSRYHGRGYECTLANSWSFRYERHSVILSGFVFKQKVNSDSKPIANQIVRILNEIQDHGDGFTKQTIIGGALAELGLDSLDFMRLLVRVETEFGLEIESAEWEKLKSSTVEQLSKYVADRILGKENL